MKSYAIAPMFSRLPIVAALLLAALRLPSDAKAGARTLDRFEYFCPVSLQLVLSRQLPTAATGNGTKDPVAVTRYGNRDLISAVVAEHGGKAEDWRIVAYAESLGFDSLDDLIIVARGPNGAMVPVGELDLSGLTLLSAHANAYDVTRSADGTLLSASFDQRYVATFRQTIAGGLLVATGTVSNKVTFGPIVVGGLRPRVFKPDGARFTFTGSHASDAGDAVAELTLTFDKPLVVPVLGPDAGGGVTITPIEGGGTVVSPN